MDNSKCQEYYLLKDYSNTKVVNSFSSKKSTNMVLASVYDSIYNATQDDYWSKRSKRLKSCASFLKFRLYNNIENMQLKKMSTSCKVRLCPICAWRRSLKIFSHALKIFSYLENNEQYSNKYDYLMLTLTVRNCLGMELSNTIDWLMKSFDKLMKRRELKRIIKGWYRGLEITHNHNVYSKSYNTYHPHYHVILVVNHSYLAQHGDKVGYLSRAKWLQLWKECTGDNTITQVDIREIDVNKKRKERISKLDTSSMTDIELEKEKRKASIIDSTCEVVKYAVKDSDYIISWDWNLTNEVVSVLDIALRNRRLIAWGGVLKEIHKRLNLDDEVDGDLVNIDNEQINISDVSSVVDISAFWHVGLGDYVIYKVENKSVEEALASDEQEKSIDNVVKLNNKKALHSKYKRICNYDSVLDAKNFEFDVPSADLDEFKQYLKSKNHEKTTVLCEKSNKIEKNDIQLVLDGLEVFELDNKK